MRLLRIPLQFRIRVRVVGDDGEEVLGYLANLPVAAVGQVAKGGLDLVPVEGCKGDDRPAPYRWAVLQSLEHGAKAPRVSDCSEGGDRRFAAQLITVMPGNAVQTVDQAPDWDRTPLCTTRRSWVVRGVRVVGMSLRRQFSEGCGGHLHNLRCGIVEEECYGSDQTERRWGAGDRGDRLTTNGRVGVG